MKESSSDFRDTLLELIDSSPASADHPSPDRWLAYHRGELSAEEEEALQEHLVRCRDCFDLSAAAAAFARPEEEPGAGEEMETAAVWRLLRPQLDPPPSNVREISASPRRQRAWKTSFPSTLAASFFVALVGLSGYSLHQKNELVALHQKNELLVSHQKNELLALQAPRPAHIVGFAGGERASASPETTLSAADAPWTFVFNPDADDQLYRDDKLYRLRLRDMPSKRERWAYELRPDQDSELAISVPELAPGRYRLELSDGSGFYEQYLLRVTAPGRGD